MMEAAEVQLEQSYRMCVCVCVSVSLVQNRSVHTHREREEAFCGTPAHTHHPGYGYLTSGFQLEEP